MNALISIIVPVYNTEKYLDRCIASIVNQTYKNLQIIIVNDGSTDASEEIIKKYLSDERVVYVKKQNGGLSLARNLGLNLVKGEFVAFVDSDDYIDLDMYECMVDKMQDCDLCICGYYLYDEKSEEILSVNGEGILFFNREEAIELLCDDQFVRSYFWNKLFRASLFDHVSFPEHKNYEDLFIMQKILLRCNKIVHINQPKYHYYQRSDSIVHTKSLKNTLDSYDAYMERYRDLKEVYGDKYSDMIKKTVFFCYLDDSSTYRKELKYVLRFLKEDDKWEEKLPENIRFHWKWMKRGIPYQTQCRIYNFFRKKPSFHEHK